MKSLLFLLMFPCLVYAQYVDSYPRELLKYENAICRVSVQDRDGSQSHGSGCLIESPLSHRSNGKAYVLSCYHVIRERIVSPGSIRVTWDGEKYYVASVAAARPGCDTVLLEVPGIDSLIPRVPIAAKAVARGELAYAFGFGDTVSNRLRCTGGPVVEFTSNTYGDPVWFDVAGSTRSGDSGGPVFVVRGGQPYIVGNAWGSSFDTRRGHHTVAVSRLRVIDRLFGKEAAATNPNQGGRSALVGYGSSSSGRPSYSPAKPIIVSGGS